MRNQVKLREKNTLGSTSLGSSEFEWMSYSDLIIQACILPEFLATPNIWHMKALVVVYGFIPNCEPIITRELTCNTEYMPWFIYHGKSYLLSEEARGRQHHKRRPLRVLKNPRSREAAKTGPSSTPMQEEAPMAILPPVSIARLIWCFHCPRLFYVSTTSCTTFLCFNIVSSFFYTTTSVPTILHTDVINVLDDDDSDNNVCTDYVCNIDKKSVFSTIDVWDIMYLYVNDVSNTTKSLFYQGGPSSQPPVRRTEETQWQLRSTPSSTTDEGKREEGSEPKHITEGGGDDKGK
ncbi:hypothetical protein PVK06_035757 [Gossypium arboreum]|uniref:Uncharacterized protein n=1 Tax=Gossypium arboreum TaxID=29729 RepID=A0ABR0NIU4_GOSAR|nr:hypothetical protein PVK06_035757 [Gossypium arboreum]